MTRKHIMISSNVLKGMYVCLLLLTMQPGILRAAYNPNDYKCPRGSTVLLDATSTRQELHSINWPQHYENNEDCRWIIRAPQDKRIKINVVFYHLEPFRDNLKIYAGTSSKADCNVRLSGAAQSSLEYIICSNEAFIHFYTDSQNTNSGFLLRYQSVAGDTPSKCECTPPAPSTLPANQCPHNTVVLDATSDLQDLRSNNNLPDYYAHNLDCWWNIRAPQGVLNITVIWHHIADSPPCEEDALVIYDPASSASVCKVQLCGRSKSSRSFITSSNEAFINFYSDWGGSSYGYYIKYQYVNANTKATIPCKPLESVAKSPTE